MPSTKATVVRKRNKRSHVALMDSGGSLVKNRTLTAVDSAGGAWSGKVLSSRDSNTYGVLALKCTAATVAEVKGGGKPRDVDPPSDGSLTITLDPTGGMGSTTLNDVQVTFVNDDPDQPEG